MKKLAFAAVCGMLVGAVLAISIIFAFSIRNSTAAFVIGVGCGVVGSYVGIYAMARRS